MRKYLWALALCGAAGMAVPSWAQERSKSLFGLGRTKPAATPADDASRSSKLRNYGELFGDKQSPVEAPNAEAPTPESVRKLMEETQANSVSADPADSVTPKAAANTRTMTIRKGPVTAKTSLLDDTEELDRLEALDEIEESREYAEAVSRTAPAQTITRPAPPAAAEGRVAIRPQVKAAPPVKTAANDKPAWATESAREEALAADFAPTTARKPAPPVKPARSESAVVSRPAPKAPVVQLPSVEMPVVARSTKSRLGTPISVIAETEDVAQSGTLTQASAYESEVPAPEPIAARPTKSRLTVTRSNTRPVEKIPAVIAESTRLADTYTRPVAKSSDKESQSPNVTVEWRSTGAVTVGQQSSCDLIVKNTGSVNAKDVEIEAKFPSNVRLVGSVPLPESGSDLVWEFDEIAPGEEKIVQVNFIPVERGEVAASANVRFTRASSTSFAVTEPLLSVKLEGSSEVMVGESASQTLLIGNPGTGTAANVKVEALISAGLEHARGERLTMELGNLAPGENRPIRLAMIAVAGGRQVVEVHVTADNGLAESAAAEVTVIAPSLAATIEGPGLRYLGRHATYTLRVSNDGAASTDGVRVMHKIPEGFEFISAERGAQYDPQNRMLNWFVGRMEQDEEAQLAVVLNAKSTGEFTHFIRATSERGAISDAEVSTRVEGAASLVVTLRDIDDPVEVGAETAYEIQIKNEGTAPAQNVGLTCELPAGMEFLTASGDSHHAHDRELVVFQPVADVAAGKTLTYRVKVKGTLSGNMRFRTKVSSDSLAEPLASEELTKIYGE